MWMWLNRCLFSVLKITAKTSYALTSMEKQLETTESSTRKRPKWKKVRQKSSEGKKKRFSLAHIPTECVCAVSLLPKAKVNKRQRREFLRNRGWIEARAIEQWYWFLFERLNIILLFWFHLFFLCFLSCVCRLPCRHHYYYAMHMR